MQDDLAPVWKALASPWRRRILDLLREGPALTGSIAEKFPELSRFAVMQHLKVLEAGNLILRRKQGRAMYNSLNPVPIQQIYHRWVRQYEANFGESLIGLKHEVERDMRRNAPFNSPAPPRAEAT